jgi:hypothetical protein
VAVGSPDGIVRGGFDKSLISITRAKVAPAKMLPTGLALPAQVASSVVLGLPLDPKARQQSAHGNLDFASRPVVQAGTQLWAIKIRCARAFYRALFSRPSSVASRSRSPSFSPMPSARNRSRTRPCAPTIRKRIPRAASLSYNRSRIREPARSM